MPSKDISKLKRQNQSAAVRWVLDILTYCRKHPIQTLITAVILFLLIKAAINFIDWAIFRAVWYSPDGQLCRAEDGGACWAVIQARWRIIVFGLYPFDEQWRSAVACVIIIATGVVSCVPWFWSLRRLAMLWVLGFVSFTILMSGGILGLSLIPVRNWGGLSLTLYVFASVCILTMVISIVLVLMRQSKLVFISKPVQVIVDFIRSLPLLVVLFTAAVVLPFGLPDWMIGEKLFRVIAGFALYNGCYQAEVLRGGIQSLPIGQEEAANALGLGYWHRWAYIILPQAFKITLPSTINQVVIIFLETSLIVIIGFFEVLASGNAAFGTAEWSIANVEVYIFIGFIFFIIALSLTRYGAHLEARLEKDLNH